MGAGHNGLVCAIRAATAGCEVLVVEQGPRPGGALASAEDTLPGFVHDICAGFFPQALVSPALWELAPVRDLEWINPEIAMAHPFLDGQAIASYRGDVAATAASLDAVAPGTGAAWAGLVERVAPHRELLWRTALSRFPPVGPPLRLAAQLRAEALRLAVWGAGPAARMGRRLFGDDRATAWLCGSVSHADLGPGSLASGALAFGLTLLSQLVGWPFPRGGAGRITEALVHHLHELGGEVRCDARVEEIEVRGRRATGVRLAGGERFEADAVVVTAGPPRLEAMLPAGTLFAPLGRRLRRWRYGLGTFKLDLALDGPVPWRSAVAREAGVVHVGDTLEDLHVAYREAESGRVPERPVMVVGQHSLHDPSRAPAGRHTLYVYARVPQRPELADEQVAERMEGRIEQFAPGFRDLILARRMRSPADLEHHDPALGGGDLSLGSMRIGQLGPLRPAPRLCRGRTPIDRLYVAGGWVHPGPGVNGVSGDVAARAALRDIAE